MIDVIETEYNGNLSETIGLKSFSFTKSNKLFV